MQRKAEKAEKKYFDNEEEIKKTINSLLTSSYTADDLIREFPEIESIIPQLDNDNSKKR